MLDYEEYPDGTFGTRMPSWEDDEPPEDVYDDWKQQQANSPEDEFEKLRGRAYSRSNIKC